MWIVIEGNPVDGIRCYGPFIDPVEANDWADENVNRNVDWWVTKLWPYYQEHPRELLD